MAEATVVTLQLTLAQAEALDDILNDVQDAGPQGQGWASPRLADLRWVVSEALDAARGRHA